MVQKKRSWFALVIAISGKIDIEYTYFDPQDSNFGAVIGTINRDEEVILIRGKVRKSIIEKCLSDLWKSYFDIKRDIDTIKLIQAMNKK